MGDENTLQAVGAYQEKRLNRIATDCAEEGWDSYSARPVTPEAIAAVKQLLASTWVVPTNRGGIQISFGGDELVSIVVGPSGEFDSFWLEASDLSKWLQSASTPNGSTEAQRGNSFGPSQQADSSHEGGKESHE